MPPLRFLSRLFPDKPLHELREVTREQFLAAREEMRAAEMVRMEERAAKRASRAEETAEREQARAEEQQRIEERRQLIEDNKQRVRDGQDPYIPEAPAPAEETANNNETATNNNDTTTNDTTNNNEGNSTGSNRRKRETPPGERPPARPIRQDSCMPMKPIGVRPVRGRLDKADECECEAKSKIRKTFEMQVAWDPAMEDPTSEPFLALREEKEREVCP